MTITRSEAEDFLFDETDLIDRWEFSAWAGLFAEDGEYMIPANDRPDGDPRSTLYLIFDDHFRIQERAKRMLSRHNHSEHPRSTVRHMVSNVRVAPKQNGRAAVTCNMVVYRSKGDQVDCFPCHCEYELSRADDGAIRIHRKKVLLDTQSLRTQRKLSIVL